MAINQLEKGIFLSLFNRGGYVLDFSTNDFDNFTLMSVGVALCERYQLSKGKSLTAYLNECPDRDALKLLNDLLEYYELHYEGEYTRPDENGSGSYSSVRYSAEYARYYRKARAILDRENAGRNPFEGASEYLKEQFSSEYMTAQIDSLMNMRETNPTEAIGKAKELVESCCKTILKETGVEVPSSWDMNELIKATKKKLDINTESVPAIFPRPRRLREFLGASPGLWEGLRSTGIAGDPATARPLTSSHFSCATPSSRLVLASPSSSTCGIRICGGKILGA